MENLEPKQEEQELLVNAFGQELNEDLDEYGYPTYGEGDTPFADDDRYY